MKWFHLRQNQTLPDTCTKIEQSKLSERTLSYADSTYGRLDKTLFELSYIYTNSVFTHSRKWPQTLLRDTILIFLLFLSSHKWTPQMNNPISLNTVLINELYTITPLFVMINGVISVCFLFVLSFNFYTEYMYLFSLLETKNFQNSQNTADF